MNITILGSGNIATGLAKHLSKAKHIITISGRNRDKASALATEVSGKSVVSNAADGADIVIVATLYADAITALKTAGDLAGKTVIDVTNPLSADYMSLTIGHTTSAAEEIQCAFPSAHVVKAFNTVFAEVLASGPTLKGATIPIFFAGDDASAKQSVEQVIRSIGFNAVDSGPLKNARYLESLAPLSVFLRFGAGRGHEIAPSWIGI